MIKAFVYLGRGLELEVPVSFKYTWHGEYGDGWHEPREPAHAELDDFVREDGLPEHGAFVSAAMEWWDACGQEAATAQQSDNDSEAWS